MMKKSIHLLLTLLLSALVTYGGSGVNAYFYCCDDCRSEGPEAITGKLCCEIHSHDHETLLVDHRHNAGEHLCEMESHDSCGVERISFSWKSFTRPLVLQPLAIELNDAPFPVQKDPHSDQTQTLIFCYAETGCQKPPNLSSKVYLAMLTILLI